MPCDRRALRSELQRKRARSSPDTELPNQAVRREALINGRRPDILALPLLEACQVLARQPELVHDPRLAAVKSFLASFLVPPPPKPSYGPSLLNIELRLLPRIVQLVQHWAEDLASCAAVCRDLHAVSKPMLAVQREHIWHSSNINLPLLLVRRGQPECWMQRSNSAHFECYEARRDAPHVRLRPCSAFRAGDHPEPFNQLHGYYTLTSVRIPGRYQGGLFYPYVGMSREGAANCPPQLCAHPPDDHGLCIVLAFVCPLSGFYSLSDVGIRLFDERGEGPVLLFVYALRQAGDVAEQLLSFEVEGRLGQSAAVAPLSVQLRAGDRILFAVATGGREGPPLEGGFRFGASRLTWSIRHGLLDEHL